MESMSNGTIPVFFGLLMSSAAAIAEADVEVESGENRSTGHRILHLLAKRPVA